MQTEIIEKPMLFSGPMVRAILEGRKIQTRRVVKFHPGPGCYNADGYNTVTDRAIVRVPWTAPNIEALIKCPHPVGSRIWVRESFSFSLRGVGTTGFRNLVKYSADLAEKEVPSKHQSQFYRMVNTKNGRGWLSRPSIHMPRWASRITLEVTDVRVQRLQEITDEDAYAEGITDEQADNHYYDGPQPIMPFIHLWESINGPDAWAANPWVWVYSLKMLEAPHGK